MKAIDRILSGLTPYLDMPQEDLDQIVNFCVMERLVEKIYNTSDIIKTSRVGATQFVIAMKINVSDFDDVEKAADFLYQGFRLMVKTVKRLCGEADFNSILRACEDLSIEC
jgi:SepF-like predicted cell division protein (DUF552 family)